jgi:hypothetical protein
MCEYDLKKLEVLILKLMENCELPKIQGFFRHCYRFMDAYKYGLTGLLLEYAVKKFKGHRCIQASQIEEVKARFNERIEQKRKETAVFFNTNTNKYLTCNVGSKQRYLHLLPPKEPELEPELAIPVQEMFEAVDSDSDDSIDPSENNLADEIDDDNIDQFGLMELRLQQLVLDDVDNEDVLDSDLQLGLQLSAEDNNNKVLANSVIINEIRLIFSTKNLVLTNVPGDGNCLFHCLSCLLKRCGIELSYDMIRQQICQYLRKKRNKQINKRDAMT